MIGRRLLVSVLWVSMAIGVRGAVPLQAADQAPAPKSGRTIGILTHFEYNWTKTDTLVTVKAEGAKEETRYLLAPKSEAVDPKLQAEGKPEPSAEVVQKAILDSVDGALRTPRK